MNVAGVGTPIEQSRISVENATNAEQYRLINDGLTLA